ncbi:alpha/beta hydrolase [Alteromonas pelagimontana]|uniref:Alpha/beta hydrolase n=1 Tax=Alteromonas pelagimontana TaxID=1858656 RepID=A0A6M4MDW9_9ALTE|nr:alpha/beta hydrolase [Alteromonas pelagimontana]QJR81302.1 alpha/beta hydrolase [Alteromonas pelagimontana]
MTQNPVLFLPGTLCDERVWLPVWRQLAIVQRRYVPLQWAGTLEEMLALTGDRVLDGEKVHLIGFSMGGFIATQWACSNVEKVASLTLVAYNPKGLDEQELVRRRQLITMLKKGQFKPESPVYVNRFVHPEHQKNPDVTGVIQEMGKDLGRNTLLAQTAATTPRADLTSAIAKAPFPVNIIAAQDDEIVAFGDVQKVAASLPGATFFPIDRAGHMALLEKPSEIAAMLKEMYA